MGNRQHILVDDKAGEVHDAIRGRIDGGARGNIDAAMPGRVRGRGRNERAKNLVRAAHRPGPAGLGCGRRRGDGEAAEHECDEERETKHPLIVAKRGRQGRARAGTAHNRPGMRPVGERCYPCRSIQNLWMTTRVRYPINWMHTTTQSFRKASGPVRIAWPCADTRFRAKRCG